MGYDIGTGNAPAADVGGKKNPLNPDTYEPTDDNGGDEVQA